MCRGSPRRDPERLGHGREALGVGGDPRHLLGALGQRGEHVDAEGSTAAPAQGGHVGAHLIGGAVAGREEPEPARVAHRGGQRDGRRAAGHRRGHDPGRDDGQRQAHAASLPPP